ncbi:Stp1/IreP family PP2C-type Ser/Thr phosphatase [Paenibacillus sp. NPDC056579]|uniref:Stp1/IreP family PP2C-type Ser/Thr phosphatase n=1 Tax=unclassified Paenibacillus TaxID=185978 RepID=UPI001EF84001|nr:Stp1/IreP family PP2C-type Ser/Thr phosphatase [Paenibacillus sp. H1-7]ULL17406.1 Stp1/IreP family PP2C-type Ser/Thr phosphatase [Paenibacillus sp. H1-7]
MVKTANQTDVGRVRMVNEDRSVVQENLNGFVLAIVADGMGGHQAGDVASQMAVDLIQNKLQNMPPGASVEERKKRVKEAIELANENIFNFASQRENYYGMGTTVVTVLADEHTVVIGHIGDSRAYKFKNGQIEQLTEDHSLVNELVKNGQITKEEATHHPRRNVLTRALGTEPTIEVDIQDLPWTNGELLLICSDGLSSLVSTEQLLTLVNGAEALDDKAKQLVNEALEAGGDDNITVVLVSNAADPEAGEAVHFDGETG